ncbi:MAG TPA: response regulator [Terriglobales bacterium]|nr:response regulator [Terriglobales bacterium]
MQPTSVPVFENFLLCCPPPDRGFDVNTDSGKQPASRKRCIFVVDDERTIADTLAEILSGGGFEAIPFYDSREVMEQVEQRCPDVLLTDVVMPHLNGVELATLISERCPQTRVLLLSGQAATANLLRGASKGGKRFELLSKPLDPRILLKKLAA